MPFRKILLPVDGSKHSLNAAEYAVALAQATGARVILVTVYRGEAIVTDEPPYQTIPDEMRQKAEHRLSPYREMMAKAGVAFDEMILEGPTAEAIADAAQRREADLIVMGSKGRSNLGGLIFGSNAHTLLHISPCPVMAIRLRHHLNPGAAAPGCPPAAPEPED
ncbi:MAG: universal stress protein [Desulfovibrionaceae bacterium]